VAAGYGAGSAGGAGTPISQLQQPAPAQAPAGGGLQQQMGALTANAQQGSAPMPNKNDIGMQEFQNLAVLHHKLAERVAQLEKELTRLGQEHQDLKRVVGKRLL
jgi:hypothetical protein